MHNTRGSLLLFSLTLTGCAVAPAPQAPIAKTQVVLVVAPATAPADPNAGLLLDQIEPRPQHPKSAPATQPAAPPLEAVLLFAKSRIAVLDGQRAEAGELLEQAIALDPGSFQLHKSLGDLYATASDARAIEQWEKAAGIDSDHLDLQISLGRHALDDGDVPKGIEHFRLALLTTDYRRDDPAAGEADFLLARALQKQGYDRASLEMYERLLGRMQNPRLAVRVNPQVATLLSHPDALALHIAALYEKNKAYGSALKLLGAIASRQPSNFAVRSRMVRDSAMAGDRALALHDAADLVVRFHADRESLALLSDVAGNDSVDVLRQLHQADPRDRELVYALCDALRARGRTADAGVVLTDAARRWPDDLRVLRRQVDLMKEQGDLKGAARQVILFLSKHSEQQLELAPLWDSLARPSRAGTLRPADVQAIAVPTQAEPAKLLLLVRSAERGHRDALQREALLRATAMRPVFAPAWREMLALIWSDESRTKEQKSQASQKLADELTKAGDAALACELRGQALLDQGLAQGAANEFAAAVKAGNRSAELYLNFAAALHGISDDKGAEALLWKVVNDRPLSADAYTELYALYEKRNEPEQAQRVLSAWLAADPDSAVAPRLQARAAILHRRFTEAEQILLDLFDRQDNDPQVLGALQQFYSETARLEEWVSVLEKRFAAEPWNSSLAMSLADIYQEQHRRPEALRLLDALRISAASDPDLLYTLSGVYSRMGEGSLSERLLLEVLKLDPSYAGANNDLGYTWAEQGKNLTQAEMLVRKALQAEPENLSFLDTMGWVLYKRGRFDEAMQSLVRAALLADPVVLDHLGDSLYRLGDRARAALQWRQATQRIAELHEEDRDDRKQLRQQLLLKQKQADAGQPVEVAPVAEAEKK